MCIKLLNLVLVLYGAISGGVIICIGVYLKTYYYEYEVFLDQQYFYVPNILLALGFLIFIISFLGFCGVFTKSSCLMLTWYTLCILIFILALSLGIAGYTMKDQAKSLLEEKLNATITDYNTTADTRKAWDEIQNNFSCCGVKGPDDWVEYNMTIPASCYKIPEHAIDMTEQPPILQTIGCVNAFGDFLKERNMQIIGLSFAAVLLFVISVCHRVTVIKPEEDTKLYNLTSHISEK